MEARYGKARKAAADKRLIVVLASLLGAALLGFVIWASFGKAPSITGVVSSVSGVGKHSLMVSLTVDNPTGKAVSCQVSAINSAESSVGSVQVDLAAGQTSVQKMQIVTVEPAHGAVVDSCWNR